MSSDHTMSAGAPQRHEQLRTSCGRQLTVGRIGLGDAARPAERIFVDLGSCPGCEGIGWAGLTMAEARLLAAALLSQVTAAEQDSRPRHRGARHATPGHRGAPSRAAAGPTLAGQG